MTAIRETMALLTFPQEAVDFFESIHRQICAEPALNALLEQAIPKYLAGEKVDDTLQELSRRSGIHPYSVDMLFLLCCCPPLKERYLERGIPLEIYRDTLMDLRYKLQECWDVYGIHGTFVFFWDQGFFTLDRFKLGRLQFETSVMYCDYKHLKKGQKVLTCHIPSCGPLTPEEVEESFRKAYEFYGCTDEMAVTCHSWLLYPPHYELFPEGGNIRRFYERFELMSEDVSPDNDDSWRIFHSMEKDPAKLPADTRLQQNFRRYLQNGGSMGEGYGVIFYKPE